MKTRLGNNFDFDTWFVPGVAIVLSIIISFFNIYIGLIAFALTGFGVYKTYKQDKKRKDYIKNYLDELDIAFEGVTKNAIFNMPFPVALLNDDYKLLWYNNRFKTMSNQTDSLVDRNITQILPNLDKDAIAKQDKSKIYELFDKKYVVYTNHVKEKGGEDLTLIYLIDDTSHQDLISEYENTKLVMTSIHIDNYDELMTNTPSERRPLLFAQIDRLVSVYFHDRGASIKKYENDKYIGVLTASQLKEFEKDKFTIVDRVRDTKIGNTIPPTLSIGFGRGQIAPRENEKASNAALDVALGRGGDQIVVKNGEDLQYYGGQNKATQKRTKVKARVIAHALAQLVDKSTEVFVMGHKNPDMDSFGSALGLFHAVERRNKDVYIVLKEVTPAIKNLYVRAISMIDGLEANIITPDEAYEKARASSLIIVTDNHRRNSTEEPRLFEKSSNIFLIDHHRRGKDYIDNATLIYMEPYASSSSELVTEMLMYMGEDIAINETVAEGLLAGITVDTKNFFYQTGVRTFEAASVLKRYGADSMVVKQLFKDDIELIKYKSEIIASAEKYHDSNLIGVFNKQMDSSSLIASQAADDLLNADGIEASYVLTTVDGKTHISARSLGAVSVQLIMEKLNGGGHLTAAATQLDMSIEDAIVKLKETIDSYKLGE